MRERSFAHDERPKVWSEPYAVEGIELVRKFDYKGVLTVLVGTDIQVGQR